MHGERRSWGCLDWAAGILVAVALAASLAGSAQAVGSLYGVAGDANTGAAGGRGVLLYSSNTHLNWFTAQGADTDRTYYGMARAAGRFFTGADDGSIWWSLDSQGTGWAERARPGAGAILDITVAGSSLVAVGDGGQILRSVDLQGGNWVAESSPVSQTLRGVAANGVATVAVGDAGVIVRGGASGTGWTRINVGETRQLLDVFTITGSPTPRFLAIGTGGAMWVGLPDGQSWTPVTAPTSTTMRSGTSVGATIVVVGDAGTIYVSPGDLATWDLAISPTAANLRDVTFTGSDVLAVGDGGSVLRSILGLEWDLTPVPVERTTWGSVKARYRSGR